MITAYLNRSTSAAPLAIFRIAFGLLLFGSVVRFWANGWVYDLYIKPTFFFSFFGFEFVKPVGVYTYVLFAVCGLAALFVAFGFLYRISAATLFLSFTYIELIDKTTYLNHYYFISILCLIIIFLPANVFLSIDAWRDRKLRAEAIPQWTIDCIKVFVCILYFFAGLAKVNSDWLLEAQPLRIWLPAKNDLPVVGKVFDNLWVAYFFSWIGCLYDLSIPFLLWNKSTRIFAYIAVIIFHVLTALLFPIGMFPYIMIATGLIFFSATFHERIALRIKNLFGSNDSTFSSPIKFEYSPISKRLLISGFAVFFTIQLILPFRYAFYPGELFWTEEGYRFSWRVMLMEKAGFAEFTVKDKNGKYSVVDNRDYLTPLQEKQMSFQPDMILQYAHHLRDEYQKKGFDTPEVYVDSYVTLNGRLGRPMIAPNIDLALKHESFSHKDWILSLSDDIKGF
jgi:hypothetical protein